ncbi:ABC-2 type transporter domain containing protein [Naviculisporaceae sp. PSN 640]
MAKAGSANNSPGGPSLSHAKHQSFLNPKSASFRATEWAKAVVEMVSRTGGSFRSSGICFQALTVHGVGTGSEFQLDVGNVWLSLARTLRGYMGGSRRRVTILDQFDGLVRTGEMLMVLGPPGSGCSTLLKTLAGETDGLSVGEDSYFNYKGITAQEMHSDHRGEAIYTAELDVHFPMMTVGDTLTFAARARQPRDWQSRLPSGFWPDGDGTGGFAEHLRDVAMAMFGISHTVDSPVGNDVVRGISGGERKRLSICEAALSGAALQCWDNSTRGLDSANALEFCKNLRLSADHFRTSVCVSLFQAPQAAYDLFDNVTVLYDGCQIFFGRADEAKQYFVDLGFICPSRQTTPDFLTSMTSPTERSQYIRPGFQDRVPRTPEEFVSRWKNSPQFRALQTDIERFKTQHPLGGPDAAAFRQSKAAQQARAQRAKSPFMLSYWQQVRLCLWRGWRRWRGDPSLTVGGVVGNFIMALIVGSVFYNLQETTSSFFQRGALVFFACLLNAFSSALEILTLFAQRPIVEKHSRYAFYHPSAEALSSMLCDMPFKLINTVTFNTTLYFLTNLRREPHAFFFYLLISFSTSLVMSMIFRTIASASRTLFQAMVPAGILMLDLIIFAGFVIPKAYMLGWSRWLSYLNPLAYAFESLIVNEFHKRRFPCNDFVPSNKLPQYDGVAGNNRVCRSVGARPGQDFVWGDDYISSQFEYDWANRWRNYGVIIAFTVVLMGCYLVAAERVSGKKSKGETLIYRLGHKPSSVTTADAAHRSDAESSSADSDRPAVLLEKGQASSIIRSATQEGQDDAQSGKSTGKSKVSDDLTQQKTAALQWQDVCYDIKIKKETRRILDHVDGWVKPGTLTALMGVSGAGKTSLLDCLAGRSAIGIVSGEILVDGMPRHLDPSFQRKTGYVQQQDLHLPTATVREALVFSAVLRQPRHVPRAEKVAYVEEVIRMLDMDEYADAVIGSAGNEGLNVEQRKRLTIAVELAARPPFLLFVDEPTSGLDSQTSWAIIDLLWKLSRAGQAILCTIHQPSAVLFHRFDRLLLLAAGGKTVYFGEIGEDARALTGYLERNNGGIPCPQDANPAEWMLQVIGARETGGSAPADTDVSLETASDSETNSIDWFKTWRESPEYRRLQSELDEMGRGEKLQLIPAQTIHAARDHGQFAAPFTTQLRENLSRSFQQYWRSPIYIYSRAALCTITSLFIGLVLFRSPNTIQGLQSQMFSIFNLFTIFGQIIQQMLPQFILQRGLYEARERPSKVYSWQVFMLSQILVEIPWNCLMSVLIYVCWYYPLGLYRNAEAAGEMTERGLLVFLFILLFMVFAGTFATLVIAGQETAEAGGNLSDLLVNLSLIFCGILVSADDLPKFWIFMNRISPFTYLVSGMLSAGVANSKVVCAENELLSFDVPAGTPGGCREYMAAHVEQFGGYLVDAGNGSSSTSAACLFCPMSETNKYLETVNISYADRWRNFGIVWAYVLFNIGAALLIYWLARVPKTKPIVERERVNKDEQVVHQGETGKV